MKIHFLFKNFFLIVISVVFTILLTEAILRIFGYKPWKFQEVSNIGIYQNDENKGWISKKGVYKLPSPTNHSIYSLITILEDGSRLSGEYSDDLNKIIFIGGSFTQGWGVDDNETYAYKVQQKLKNYKVKNYGQGGYGGVQSFLLLNDIIGKNLNTKLIIYGFIDHHEYRNVARSSWLEILLKYSNSSHQQTPQVPYATILNNGNLDIKKPITYLKLPLRERLVVINLIEKTYMKLITKKRKSIQKQVVNKIALKMKEISISNDAEFVFLNLKSDFREYVEFFEREKINYIDCNLNLTNDYLIENDYHPNEKAHTFYSNCIINNLKNKNLLF